MLRARGVVFLAMLKRITVNRASWCFVMKIDVSLRRKLCVKVESC